MSPLLGFSVHFGTWAQLPGCRCESRSHLAVSRARCFLAFWGALPGHGGGRTVSGLAREAATPWPSTSKAPPPERRPRRPASSHVRMATSFPSAASVGLAFNAISWLLICKLGQRCVDGQVSQAREMSCLRFAESQELPTVRCPGADPRRCSRCPGWLPHALLRGSL